MITEITRKALNARAAGLLLALCLIQTQVGAQEAVSFIFHTNSWRMARGQTARFSVSHPDVRSDHLALIQVTLFDESGVVIGRCEEIAIPPGELRSVDFNYDELFLAGHLADRVRTRAEVRYRSFPIVDRTQLQVWPTSIELIDDATGFTTLVLQ